LSQSPTMSFTMSLNKSVAQPVRMAGKGSSKASAFVARTQLSSKSVSSSRARKSFVTHASEVSTNYAEGLIDIAQEAKALEAVHKDMEALESTISAEVTTFLSNPLMDDANKRTVVSDIAKEHGFSAFTTNFLNLLIDTNRIEFIADIIADFEEQYCKLTDTEVATVTSAVKLENEQQFLIAKKLQELTGAKNIKLKPSVDEALLGGFVVQFGEDGSNKVDMSLKTKLKNMGTFLDSVEQPPPEKADAAAKARAVKELEEAVKIAEDLRNELAALPN